MTTQSHIINNLHVEEIIADEVIIKTTQDVLCIMGNYPADAYIFYTHHFEPNFFDLSTKKLGEIIQKFANYRIKVAIIGDFSVYPSQTLKQYMYETNKFGEYLFVNSIDAVKQYWQT